MSNSCENEDPAAFTEAVTAADLEIIDQFIKRKMIGEMYQMLTELECDSEVTLREKKTLVAFMQRYIRRHLLF
jgi:hypothetical protein